MSQKITAKNLQYTSTLPPFLARLRGQAPSDSDGPDPILAARRRPTKQRSGSAEAEDAPLVVDEHGNVVDDVSVGVDGSVKEQQRQDEAASTGANTAEESTENGKPAVASSEKLAGIGDAAAAQRKKRKMGRVIGADTDDAEDEDAKEQGSGQLKKKVSGAAKEQEEGSSASAKPKGKKKAKKIKLSFGDDEG